MLKAIHAQESREAADNKAKAIVDDLRASKMGKAADLVEQAVHETLIMASQTFTGRKLDPTSRWSVSRKRSDEEPAWSVPSRTVSCVSTWRPHGYGTSPEQGGRPNAT